jgi:hypothetical protein
MTTTWLKSDKAHLERNIQLQGELLAVEQRPVVLHPLVPPHPVENTLQQVTQLAGVEEGQVVYRFRMAIHNLFE